ncbi:autotransporter [Opitutaceae bacterium TAV5]|nr:autotransporter [Opitutaceae bacterium TAV5]
MKHQPSILLHAIAFAAVVFASAANLPAADLIKANNTTALGTAGSYTVAGATPTNADTIIFNDTLSSVSSFNSGGTTARGLRLLDPANDITLSVGNSTLSLGVNGSATDGGFIDLSSAVRNLTINVASSGRLRFYGAQSTLTVAAGRTLTVNAPVEVYHTNGGSLRVTGAGAVILATVRDSDSIRTTRLIHDDTGSLTLTGANTYTGGTTLSGGNFTLAGTGSLFFDLAKGNRITGDSTGEVRFDGTFNVSVSDIALTEDTAWTLVAGTFSNLDYGSTFSLFLGGSIVGSGITLDSTNNYTAGNWSYDISSGALSYAAVPEPGITAALAAAGMLLAVALLRHRPGRYSR